MREGRSTYSYYDYVNKYSGRFLNKFQSNTHSVLGRSTAYLELLRLKGVRMKGNRNWMWINWRLGWKFTYLIYFPQMCFAIFCYLLTPVWRRIDERYHLRFSEGEEEEIEEVEPFVTYQARKKPMMRKKFADSYKLVYEG